MPDVFLSTAATNFDKTLTEQIIKVLQTELRGTLPHIMPAVPAKFAKGTNNTLRYLRAADLSVVTGTPDNATPTAPWLKEGVTPYHEDLDFGYEEFSANQAGRLVGLTDIAMERSPLDLFSLAVEKVTRNLAEFSDKRCADVILAGTNVLYAGTGNAATGDVAAGDVVDGTLLRRAAATLKADDVPTFGGYLHAIIHPAVVFDIQGDDAVGGWIDANKYAGALALMTGEVGKYAGIRFIESSNAAVKAAAGAGGVDVYSTVVFGPGAWAFGDWGTANVYTTAPGGKGDELHQRASVGWKANVGAKLIIGPGPKYLRVESASSL